MQTNDFCENKLFHFLSFFLSFKIVLFQTIYIVTRKYDTLILLPGCAGRRPATDYGIKQESADDSSEQNNGKRGHLSFTPLYHY